MAYPQVKKYLSYYFDSLEDQTYTDFDLLIANDGLVDINSYFAERNLNISVMDVSDSIPSIRRILINQALDGGYEKIIFTDLDDTFDRNRVEVTNMMLDAYEIVVNDLDIVSENGCKQINKYFSRRFHEKQILDKELLVSGNIMGLSNTAVRAEVLQKSTALKYGDSIAFDWYLWSSLMQTEKKACFTSLTATKYRNYAQNTAGFPQIVNIKNVLKGVEVKLQHYNLMTRLDDSYLKLEEEFRKINKQITNKKWLEKYVSLLKEHSLDNAMWWENIRTLSSMRIQ